jgi:hypothetical protein
MGRGQLRVVILCLFLGVSGCSSERDEPAQPLWQSLEMSFSNITKMYLHEGALLMATGLSGVYERKPAFGDTWKHLGLSFPEFAQQPQYGVSSLVADSGKVIATCLLPSSDPRPRIYTLQAGDTVWVPRANPYGTANVNDIVITNCDTMMAVSNKGTMLSGDGGNTWTVEYAAPINGGRYYNLSDALYFSAVTDFFEVRMSRSPDCGTTWESVIPPAVGIPREGFISSASAADLPGPLLALCLDGDLYFSEDRGDTFQVGLRTLTSSGAVLINPNNSREVVVSADSLYFTTDGGDTWDAYLPPGSDFLWDVIAADWVQDIAFVGAWHAGQVTVWAFNLYLARQAEAENIHPIATVPTDLR